MKLKFPIWFNGEIKKHSVVVAERLHYKTLMWMNQFNRTIISLRIVDANEIKNQINLHIS